MTSPTVRKICDRKPMNGEMHRRWKFPFLGSTERRLPKSRNRLVLVVLTVATALNGAVAVGADEPKTAAIDPAVFQSVSLDDYSPTQVRNLVRELGKSEVKLRGQDQYAACVLALCDIHAAIRSDARYHDQIMLQSAASVARNRLLTITRDLKLQLKRAGIARPDALDVTMQELRAELEKKQQTESPSEGDSTSLNYPNDGNDHDKIGEGNKDLVGGSGPAGLPDYGWQLVELIQQSIDPDYWDVKGGAWCHSLRCNAVCTCYPRFEPHAPSSTWVLA